MGAVQGTAGQGSGLIEALRLAGNISVGFVAHFLANNICISHANIRLNNSPNCLCAGFLSGRLR